MFGVGQSVLMLFYHDEIENDKGEGAFLLLNALGEDFSLTG